MILKAPKALMLLTLAASAAMAQVSAQTEQVIRNIRIIPISTSKKGLPQLADNVREGLRSVPFTTELRLTDQSLVAALDKADRAIQKVYEENGASVRVEHEASGSAHAIEVVFRVIELCACDK